jgi:hypothetical protein
MMVHPSTMATHIKAYIDVIIDYVFKTKSNHIREPSSSLQWVSPPAGMVLINVDVLLLVAWEREW